MSSTTSPIATGELHIWLNRAIEILWLLTVLLVPLAFFDRDYAKSETIIAYVEVPKVALLRTLVGSMAVLWLIDWGLHGTLRVGSSFRLKILPSLLTLWLARSISAMWGHPHHWLFLAVGFYLGTTLLSTALSGAIQISLWGEIPGQDGYSAYTVLTYILLFTMIATRLKTPQQVWRLLGTIVAMGVLVSGYAVLQHYGQDFLNLSEATGGRTTSFMGNRIFAATVMMMTVSVTVMAAVISVFRFPQTSDSTRSRGSQIALGLAILGIWVAALAVQFLGLLFTFSRGPWVGSLFAIALMVVLVTVFVGSRGLARLALVLGLASVVTVIIFLNPSLTTGVDAEPGEPTSSSFAPTGPIDPPTVNRSFLAAEQPETDPDTATGASSASNEPTNKITVAVDPTAARVVGRFGSIGEEVLGGFSGGRLTHWKVSWNLIKDRPWFAFDHLSFRWLRPIVGYGPDLFRYTYLLDSPSEGPGLYPLEPDHAHNYFIHQTVEQGFLGTISSLGIFAAVFLAGAFQLLRSHSEMSPVHKLILVTLVSVLAGRGLEMMVGVARISDLTVFWVLLGLFAALPVAMQSPEASTQPIRAVSRRPRRRPSPPASFPGKGISRGYWLWRLAVAIWLLGMIVTLTWIKGISYPLAAIQAGQALEYSRQGDLPSTLAAIDRAIELAPDVPVYYNWRASVYSAYRRQPLGPREHRCDIQNDVSYQVCLAALTYESNLTGSNQRPFYYRSKIAVAASAFNLRLDDVAIRYYQESLDLVPGSWALRNNLASALIEQGRPGEALQPLHESLQITTNNGASTGALIIRATAYSALGRHVEAIDDLDRALEINSGDARALAARAMAYTNLGQDAQAREDADQAVKLGVDRAAMDRALEEIKQSR